MYILKQTKHKKYVKMNANLEHRLFLNHTVNNKQYVVFWR